MWLFFKVSKIVWFFLNVMLCYVMSVDLKLVLELVLERDERECIDVGV